MKPPLNTKTSYNLQHHSIRSEVLKSLHSRRMLIIICSLVVLECMIVMAEVMVDLHRIRARFENEEKQIQKFVSFVQTKHPDVYSKFEDRTLSEVLHILQHTSMLWNPNTKAKCDCSHSSNNSSNPGRASKHSRRKRDIGSHAKRYVGAPVQRRDTVNTYQAVSENELKGDIDSYESLNDKRYAEKRWSNYSTAKKENEHTRLQRNGIQLPTEHDGKVNLEQSVKSETQHYISIKASTKTIKRSRNGSERHRQKSARIRRSPSQDCTPAPDLFIFSVNSDIANYYLVTEFVPLHERNLSHVVQRDIEAFQNEYAKYFEVSNILAYAGFAIFSVMLLEILVKLACLGLRCFKKKIDVFDAFIVIVSFALDAFFLDSKWYESGKGATTVVVLLLPWRIVHIVNGFMMTIKHKHHIKIMSIKRSKKKCEIKVSKLKELVVALRRDVDLLVNLCKLKGATGPEITACIYGKGRSTATLAAITSFASLMFISTLGKQTPCDVDISDDLYGNIIRDILDDVEDDDDDDYDDESETDKTRASILMGKDDGAMKDSLEHGEIYTVTQSLRRSAHRQKPGSKHSTQRRATIPRCHVMGYSEEETASYVNDGYVTCDEINRRESTGSIKKVVKSLPSLKRETSPCNNGFLTLEVRTQVSYL